MGLTWSPSPARHDHALASLVASHRSDVHLLDADEQVDDFYRRVAAALPLEGFGHGTIAVTTACAGRRAASHEVSGRLVGAVLHRLRELYPKHTIVLMDGPAFAGCSYRRIVHDLGWEAVAQANDASVIDLNEEPSVEVGQGWHVGKSFMNAAAVVSLSKARTHRRFGLSGAEKAVLGAIPGNRYGYPKLEDRHEWVPWLLHVLGLAHRRVAVAIDGIDATHREGPMSGDVLPSRFAVTADHRMAADVRLAIEMGFDPALVPSLLRPLAAPRDDGACGSSIEWSRLRRTALDFEPARSCRWLFRSLERSAHRPGWRERRYSTLMTRARRWYPAMT